MQRISSRIFAALAALVFVFGGAAFAADAAAGKKLFRAQCALCHSAEANDGGGAQGPDLAGIFGRKAATHAQFPYTAALRAANLAWNAATLDRFLASPGTVVPGTSMPIALPAKPDRDNVIAYFSALRHGIYKEPAPPPKSGEDWKLDTPGRAHRIEADKLPPPFDTRGARNPPKFVARPADARIKLPPGFDAGVFASQDLENPRNMRLAPNGDILLVESSPGRVKVLRPAADGKSAASIETFAQGLDRPFGLALYPAGPNPEWLYVSEINRVVRFAYRPGQTQASGVPEVVIEKLAPDASGGHITRDIGFSPDGKRLYVAVGSQSNGANEMPVKTLAQATDWEKTHALGAAWGSEEKRATVLEFELQNPGPARYYATGLRNCVGLTIHPVTGDVWCTVNERDMLGDDLVPDYSTRVQRGAFYGWPWYYLGAHEDPWLKGQRPDLAGKVTIPDVLYQAHSAPITLTFYPPMDGADKRSAAFPREYWGDGFAVMHGSWNRAFRTGHKVVRVRMKDGVPTGEYADFMVGFITDAGDSWARPGGSVVTADGALLVSDDVGNVIYRVAYRPGIDLVGEEIDPESITSMRDGTVIIGSARRAIYRAAPGAATAQPWIELPADSPRGVFGVLAHEESNTLYACANTFFGNPRQPFAGTLYTFDLRSGALQGRYPLPSPNPICNDIAVDAAGVAYIVDTNNMEILRLKPRAKKLVPWAGEGAFGPTGGVLDGIAILGNRVIVNTLVTSKLFAVPVERRGKAGKVVELELDQSIDKPDGMRAIGPSTLLVAATGSGGRALRVDVQGTRAQVVPVESDLPRGIVAVAAQGKDAWLLETEPAETNGMSRRFRALRISLK